MVLSRQGTPLVYRVYGDHGPFLVGCNGVGVSTVFFEPLAARLTDAYRVVLWDYPGHGRSGDPLDATTVGIESLAEDLATVLDAAGAEQAVILGHSLGAQVSLEFYRHWPQRVLGLVPTHGTCGHAVASFFGLPFLSLPLGALAAWLLPHGHRALPPLLEPLALSPLAGRAVLDHGARLFGIIGREAPDLAAYFAHLVRIDLRVFAALIRGAQAHDASDLLTSIQVPTLVVGATHDRFVPLKVVERLAGSIPGAELFVLEGATHAGLYEQGARYEARLRTFLRERVFADAGALAPR